MTTPAADPGRLAELVLDQGEELAGVVRRLAELEAVERGLKAVLEVSGLGPKAGASEVHAVLAELAGVVVGACEAEGTPAPPVLRSYLGRRGTARWQAAGRAQGQAQSTRSRRTRTDASHLQVLQGGAR